MEIAPVPRPATRGEWRRLVAGLLLIAPVVLLFLVPAALGLDRYVVTDGGMDGSLGRGSVVLARDVAPSDLEVGDVVTYHEPGTGSDDRVVRRIVALEDGYAVTQADATGSAVPHRMPLDSTYARVWLGVPWIGYPFVVDGGWLLLLLAAFAAAVLAVSAGHHGRRPAPRAVKPLRTRLPVG